MAQPVLAIAFSVDAKRQAMVREAVADRADWICLAGMAPDRRVEALRRATVLLAWNTARDLRPGEAALLRNARLIQFMTAGVDFIPLAELPPGVPIASNGGAYARPMAEHALAMALAAAKRLHVERAKLARGTFDQMERNRMLADGVCGILGIGGVGAAMARLARAIGMRVHAINRRGATTEPVDWIGTPDQLDDLLAASDLLVVSLPLTRVTRGIISPSALARMKPDATLVNLARGEIIDEAALYRHLTDNPSFTACIDAWWVEPVRHGAFRLDHPFLELPNVIGSPHNSAQAGDRDAGFRHALTNCRRALFGEPILNLIGADERDG